MESSTSTQQQDAEREKLLKLEPLRPERLGIFKQKYSDVRLLGHKATEIINELVSQYSDDLDKFVARAEEYLEQLRNDPSKQDGAALMRMLVRLPILQYRLIDVIDKANLDADIAEQASELTFSRHFLESVGNIQQRQAEAKLKTADEELIVNLAKHVYQRLKKRIDTCDTLFDAVRKMVTSLEDQKNRAYRGDKSQV